MRGSDLSEREVVRSAIEAYLERHASCDLEGVVSLFMSPQNHVIDSRLVTINNNSELWVACSMIPGSRLPDL